MKQKFKDLYIVDLVDGEDYVIVFCVDLDFNRYNDIVLLMKIFFCFVYFFMLLLINIRLIF